MSRCNSCQSSRIDQPLYKVTVQTPHRFSNTQYDEECGSCVRQSLEDVILPIYVDQPVTIIIERTNA